MDSTSFVIYPELEATEVRFSALKRYLCSFYFRIDNETGGIHRNTLYTRYYYYTRKKKQWKINGVWGKKVSFCFVSSYLAAW